MFQEKFDDDRPLEWMVLDDGMTTRTSEQQDDVLYTIYRQYKNKPDFIPKLKRDLHIEFLLKGLEKLSHHYECLDASRPWLAYWMIHSLNLLKHPLDINFKLRAIETLRKCRNEDGGFGGGPGQTSHLASTYAAVHCLCSLNLVEAYDVIDRKKLMKWMTALKQEDGSFCLSIGGEIDIRGLYCAISVLKLLNCDKLEFTEEEVTYSTKFLYNKSSEFIARCQTFDGGLGCYPGVEAHGGYVFCGLAAIRLLGDSHLLNMELLAKWAVQRQMDMEGGYQGRCNKLVDGCYCFWVGGAFPLLHLEEDVMNRKLLQKYILKACQSPYGGCRDKPGKGVDHYHTCYVLSGLSISQYKYNIDSRVQLSQGIPNWLFYKVEPTEETASLKDEPDQILIPTHPIFNIPIESVQKTYLHFSTKPE